MKLRIQDNSLRLRLGQAEVAKLNEGQSVISRTSLPPQPLVVMLESSENQAEPRASFEDGHIHLVLPAATVRKWAGTDQVGIEATQATCGEENLHLLIEKDFPCAHRDSAENADTFPRPTMGKPSDRQLGASRE